MAERQHRVSSFGAWESEMETDTESGAAAHLIIGWVEPSPLVSDLSLVGPFFAKRSAPFSSGRLDLLQPAFQATSLQTASQEETHSSLAATSTQSISHRYLVCLAWP